MAAGMTGCHLLEAGFVKEIIPHLYPRACEG